MARPRDPSTPSPLAAAAFAAALALAGAVAWFGWQELRLRPAPVPPAGVATVRPAPAVTAPPAVPARVQPTVADPRLDAAPQLEDPALDWNREGILLLEAGDAESAAERFRAAHDFWPEVDTYANNLAEALFRRAREQATDDLAAALESMEEALAALRDDARRRELEPLRDRWRQTLAEEDGFFDYPSLHFHFSFDGTRKELMDSIGEVDRMLDRAYDEFGTLFGRRPVEEGEPRIRVVFYRRAGFDRATGLGDWAGGVFDGSIRVPVESLKDPRERERLEAVLRHELMHAFIDFVGGSHAPAWLNEGLAQWIEHQGARRRLGVETARDLLRREGTLFPLADLRGTLAAWEDQAAIRRAYAQALALVDHVVRQYGERELLDMVGACDAGGAGGAEARFANRFPGLTLDDVARDMLAR